MCDVKWPCRTQQTATTMLQLAHRTAVIATAVCSRHPHKRRHDIMDGAHKCYGVWPCHALVAAAPTTHTSQRKIHRASEALSQMDMQSTNTLARNVIECRLTPPPPPPLHMYSCAKCTNGCRYKAHERRAHRQMTTTLSLALAHAQL